MSSEELEAALRAAASGLPLHFLETTESTNLELRARAEHGAPEGSWVVARTQTGGRGRRGHRWHSPKDAGLYASRLLRGPRPLELVPLYTLAAALAARAALRAVSGLEVGIRWPNDLLCPRTLRKLGGILVESSADETGLRYAVMGVGLNLRTAEFPAPIEAYATSVEASGGRSVGLPEIFGALASALEAELRSLELEDGVPRMLARYQSEALGLGLEVQLVDDAARVISGRLAGFGPDGALLLETSAGRKPFYAGTLRLPGAPVQPEW